MERASQGLVYVIPIALLIIFVLLYLTMDSLLNVLIILLDVPLSLIGAFLTLFLLDYNLSVAVWLGIIALTVWMPETAW